VEYIFAYKFESEVLKVKKFVSLLLVVCLALTLCACGAGKSAAPASAAPASSAPASAAPASSAPASTAPESKSVDFPTKPINLIVGFGAGGGSDLAMRAVAKYAEKHLGVDIVVSNVTGGSGTIALQQLVDSAPDGYTIAYCSNTSSNGRNLFEGIKYGFESFTPIVQVAVDPFFIICNKSLGVSTLDEMIQLVQANPKKYTFAMGGTWSTHELARLALEGGLDLSFKRLTFDSGKACATAVAAGDATFASPSYAEASGILQDPSIVILATTGADRFAKLPDVPTVKELTGKDVTAYNWRGLVGPAGIDPEVLAILSEAFEKACTDPDYIQEVLDMGITAQFLNNKDFTAFFKENHDQIGELIKTAVID